MTFLIDRFKPKEILHVVGISNKLKILNTDEKKYLLAVRMGTPYSEGQYELESGEKEKFLPIFMKFINQFPMNYYCDKDDCPICERLKDIKFDFQGNQESIEYELLMQWLSAKVPEEKQIETEAQSEKVEEIKDPEQIKVTEEQKEEPFLTFAFNQEEAESEDNGSDINDLLKTNLDLLDETALRRYTLQLRKQLQLVLQAREILFEQEKDPLRKLAIKEMQDSQQKVLDILLSKIRKGIPA
ncbi:hypothetical protein [Spirochaeta cellobiosiphila]|uniref:hypothetical protein n=1 Tax=Spirochaeta cellobiosiphila TaxID=504483 RepID=UPI00041A48ED|nr:hypothetical protein [Spirochaeta cellobiosiphila]